MTKFIYKSMYLKKESKIKITSMITIIKSIFNLAMTRTLNLNHNLNL
jgi:hypothetical protein